MSHATHAKCKLQKEGQVLRHEKFPLARWALSNHAAIHTTCNLLLPATQNYYCMIHGMPSSGTAPSAGFLPQPFAGPMQMQMQTEHGRPSLRTYISTPSLSALSTPSPMHCHPTTAHQCSKRAFLIEHGTASRYSSRALCPLDQTPANTLTPL